MKYATKVLVYGVLTGLIFATLFWALGVKSPWYVNVVAIGGLSAAGYVLADAVQLFFNKWRKP